MSWLTDGGDGLADPVAVDRAAVGALGRDEMHGPILAATDVILNTRAHLRSCAALQASPTGL
jgi:hypothetical protein